MSEQEFLDMAPDLYAAHVEALQQRHKDLHDLIRSAISR